MDISSILHQGAPMMLSYGLKLVWAIAVWGIGMALIKLFIRVLVAGMKKGGTDTSLQPFLKSMAEITLKVLLAIVVLSMLGIEMTSFIAILGAVGLAFGLALSGTLQNFAGGVMILILRPFKVGDLIDAQGYLGTVSEIHIFHTTLKTPDNKTIIIPNSGLSTSSMINYSTEETRRVDWSIDLAYGDDVEKARALIQRICDQEPRIMKTPEVVIAVAALGESAVNLTVRAWTVSKDYWEVFFTLNESIYKEFAKAGLSIPFRQLDVHLQNNG